MNFSLPDQIVIQNFHIPTITIFIVLGVLSWFFRMWYEGRRDGFDEEKLLDLSFSVAIISLVAFFIIYKYTGWLAIYRPYNFLLKFDRNLFLLFGMFLGGGLALVYFCKFWNWSKYRLLDIYASAVSQLGFFLAFGGYFIYKIPVLMPFIVLLPLIYVLILRMRGLQFISGAMFSIFTALMIPYIILFYRASGYLFFCITLATISIINFYLRWRKNYAGTTSFGRVYKTVKRKTIKKTKRVTKRSSIAKK